MAVCLCVYVLVVFLIWTGWEMANTHIHTFGRLCIFTSVLLCVLHSSYCCYYLRFALEYIYLIQCESARICKDTPLWQLAFHHVDCAHNSNRKRFCDTRALKCSLENGTCQGKVRQVRLARQAMSEWRTKHGQKQHIYNKENVDKCLRMKYPRILHAQPHQVQAIKWNI